MGILNRLSAVVRVHGIAVGMLVGTVFLAPAASAQSSPKEEDIDLSGVADIVNLLRMVVDPSSSPVLSSPVERAVSGQSVLPSSVSAGPQVVTFRPIVTLPDIVIPEEESDVPVVAAAETEPKDFEPAVAKTLPRASAADDDDGSDTNPPFYYVFFFGEYVPYYKGTDPVWDNENHLRTQLRDREKKEAESAMLPFEEPDGSDDCPF